jgi:hypothetical protein
MYLMGQHSGSGALLRLGGRPVYYVYDSYRTPATEWAELLCANGSKTVRGTEYDGACACVRPPGRMPQPLSRLLGWGCGCRFAAGSVPRLTPRLWLAAPACRRVPGPVAGRQRWRVGPSARLLRRLLHLLCERGRVLRRRPTKLGRARQVGRHCAWCRRRWLPARERWPCLCRAAIGSQRAPAHGASAAPRAAAQPPKPTHPCSGLPSSTTCCLCQAWLQATTTRASGPGTRPTRAAGRAAPGGGTRRLRLPRARRHHQGCSRGAPRSVGGLSRC